ncbi:MAG TPA: ABC transporter permease, partial [Bacteroidota bacterium]
MTRLRSLLGSAVLEIILVVLCLFLAAVAPHFLTAENLLNVLRNVSMQGLIALGMTLVIIAGEIDLSVGSMVAFSGCLTAWLTGALGISGAGLPAPLAVGAAILLSLAAGCMSGALAGLLRNRFGVPSFISTLALLTALSGAAELITNGFPLTPFPDW